jgi:divalent metal cation (Fe/Co/Zn/Cd) transporter
LLSERTRITADRFQADANEVNRRLLRLAARWRRTSGGVAVGWDWADPVVGLLITLAILAVLRQAAREICRRLMDAVDPHLVDEAEQALRATPGVIDIGQVRLRWIGHQLRAECEIIVDPDLSAIQAHQVAVSTELALRHALPRLSSALVHADPQPRPGTDYHAVLASHQ